MQLLFQQLHLSIEKHTKQMAKKPKEEDRKLSFVGHSHKTPYVPM